jgi:hypothetical protein
METDMRKSLCGLGLLLAASLDPAAASAASIAPVEATVRMLGARVKPSVKPAFFGGLNRKVKKAAKSSVKPR